MAIKETLMNDDETMEIDFEIEDGNPYLLEIRVRIEAIDEMVEIPKSLNKRITKAAEALMMDFMETYEDTINDRLADAAYDAWKDAQ